jgi:hypothetical protein
MSVKIIQPQIEEIKSVSGDDAEQLLRKYGYYDKQITTRLPEPKNDLTFEEAIRLQEEQEAALRAKRNTKKPITFDSDNYDKQIKTVSDSGFNFNIEITTDMKLPKY